MYDSRKTDAGFQVARHYFLLILMCLMPFSAFTQPQTPSDSVKIAGLPALGFSSDLGFLAGGLIGRYHYRDGLKPYGNLQQVAVVGTTKGLFSLMYTLDVLETYGTAWRTSGEVAASRVLSDSFYGIGNATGFGKQRYKDGFYYFESYGASVEVTGRYPLWKDVHQNWQLDARIGFLTHYYDPVITGNTTFISGNVPFGASGGWINALVAGLLWEARDSETNTTKGSKAMLELKAAPAGTSDYAMYTVWAEGAAYHPVPFVPSVILAVKTGFLHSGGKVPFYLLPTIGGEYFLRGYNELRFRGDGALYYTAELRSWLLTFDRLGARIGMQVFTDGGRVFETHAYNQFFHDHKLTAGAGIALSVFTPDFIVRADMGFSDEISRMYMGIGYTF